MVGEDSVSAELRRVREVYGHRQENHAQRIYDPLNPAGLWGQVEVYRHLLWGLGQLCNSLEELKGKEILEVGCGNGSHLLKLLSLGVPPERLHGIDLLTERVQEAQSLHPGLDFRGGNALELPWPSGSMDVVMQFTCLSSVLDPEVRAGIAREMCRVLKPGGGIVSFDFVWNPINRDTVGIGKSELKSLFSVPGGKLHSRRVFLAPPLARKLVPPLPLLAMALDFIPWLCFHRIAVVKPQR